MLVKKIFTVIIFLNVFIFSCNVKAEEPILYSDSVIVIEGSTGRIIYEKNADKIYPPASMTKMLTCILTLENLSPGDEVKISHEAGTAEYSDLHLSEGDIISVHDLLLGTMLVSDNGGAIAAAQAVGGNIENFVDMMNKKLNELNCRETHFANPNGLPDPDHISTARDIAKIASYCMKNDEFREIVGTEYATIHWIEPAGHKVEALNTNELFEKYSGITGIKTGYTLTAGGCMTASAKRGDIELIAVVMHSKDMDTRFIDSSKVLDYGFENIDKIHRRDKNNIEKIVYVRDGKKGAIHVGADKDIIFPILKGEDEKFLSLNYDVPEIIDAEVNKGDVIGKVILNYDGEKVAEVPLIAKENVEKGFSIGSKLVDLTEPFHSAVEGILKFLLV